MSENKKNIIFINNFSGCKNFDWIFVSILKALGVVKKFNRKTLNNWCSEEKLITWKEKKNEVNSWK